MWRRRAPPPSARGCEKDASRVGPVRRALPESAHGSTTSWMERAPKVAVEVANRLRRRIVTGEVSVGDSLPSEASLLKEFGVSRPSMRAALRILESEDLVTMRRG